MGVATGAIHKATREIIRRTRAFTNSGVERKAQALAGNLKASRIVIEDDKGYAKFTGADIGLAAELDRLTELAAAWKGAPQRTKSDKPFLRNVLRSQDLLDHPEIMTVAMDEQLFGAVTRYLGQVPWVVALQLWWTPPNQTAIRSQLYHYDHRDTRQAKIFINLNNVGENSGPLHFLPASSSLKVDRIVGYSQDEYTDEQVERCCAADEVVKTVGPPGAGYIVDTARCLHYGSRGNSEDRLVLMICFARANCVDKGSGCDVLDPVRQTLIEKLYAADPARAFALAAR